MRAAKCTSREARSSVWPSIRLCYVRMGRWDPEWIQVGIAFVAFWAALCAGLVSWRAYKTSYRPILRVVPGGWHETEFTVVGHKFKTHRSVPRVREEIPRWVQERSQIVADL